MALSNTATPIYYGQFRDAVIRGEFPVCETISLQMNRIDDLIRNPAFYYDDQAVEGWIKFCNNELTLTDGSDLNLLFTFKLWAEDVYGWYYFTERQVWEPYEDGHGGQFVTKTVKLRLRNKQFLIIARGNAKSLYNTCHQAFGIVVDRSTTNQVAEAPTMNQAEETLGPLRTAIARARGPLFKFLTLGSLQNTTGAKENRTRLASTKQGIQNFLTNSLLEIRPMTIQKNQGYRDKYATLDEWLSCDIREDVISSIEQGSAKIDDYLIIATSSEGTIRNGPGDSIKMELMDILEANYIAPNVSIWWYKLDNIKEVANPEMWIKANPNLGITVNYETIHRDVERAEKAPAARNDILAKRFDLPLEGYTYFFTYQETLPHPYREYWQMYCSLGIDLSQGDDFCAFTFLFPLPNMYFGVKVRAYITERTLNLVQPAMRPLYDEFVKEGTLIVMPGSILDMDQVYEDLDEFIDQKEYDVCALGYDPYNAKDFICRWEREHSQFGVEKVPQGARTESVPLGEIKKMAEDRKLLFDEQLMKFAMGNCITLEDTNGNRKIDKMRRPDKIDNVAALVDAWVAFKLHKESFD